ncbi:hypothetical protein PG994_009053 [Apiospora phragmitis]|uniref:Uncharacterized protein n=1 Tax=Apiospora phragmitis TaxID=2905665 RepID=A0ABR1UI71_9PEZI
MPESRDQGSRRPFLANKPRSHCANAVLVRNPVTTSSLPPEGTAYVDNAGTTSDRKAVPLMNESSEDLLATTQRTQLPTGEPNRNRSGSRFPEIGLDDKASPQGHRYAASVPVFLLPQLMGSNATLIGHESELQTAISSFQDTLKSLKFTLASPGMSFQEKQKLRVLCSASQPAQFLLFEYVHGTPETPESSGNPQLSDKDERRLTDGVCAAVTV